MDRRRRALTEADAEAVAEKVNQKLFLTFGMDISTPEGRIEAQDAFRHMLFWHRFSKFLFKSAAGVFIAGACYWLGYRLFGWAPH